MNNIKKFYKNNCIYCILMGISIFCIAIIAVLCIIYFVNQTKNYKYGDRLNGIESVQITEDKTNEMVNLIKENELVDNASVSIKGKIIYITVSLKDGKVTISAKLTTEYNDEFEDSIEINVLASEDNSNVLDNQTNNETSPKTGDVSIVFIAILMFGATITLVITKKKFVK